MLQSKLFGKTLREAPAGEVAKNAILLERAGFVYKSMAGVYDLLPLGFRVFEKIKQIIREEMNSIGGQEVFLSSLQPKERWEKTGRWAKLGEDIMYQFKNHSGQQMGLAVTHEEPLTEIALRSINSYRDLPLYVYQFQTKFRDELRAKSGLLRGREFVMKDMYSFHADKEDLNRFYVETIHKAYLKLFSRLGLDVRLVEAAGGSFTTENTHEYQVFSEAGEDTIFYCKECSFAQNKEIAKTKDNDHCPNCGGLIKSSKSIEVGNIFKLNTAYSEPLGLVYTDERGEKKAVVMGSYGIGVGRVMATIAEVGADNKGLIWPKSVTPFGVHVLALKTDGNEVYKFLKNAGIEALYDDRTDKTAGEKFADADLIGIPWRIVVSEKTTAKNVIEVKKRDSDSAELMTIDQFISHVK